jgi:tetratricopeptide (TPR) repeat protein
MADLESKLEESKTTTPSLEQRSSTLGPQSSRFAFGWRWLWVVGMVLILAAIGVAALKPWQRWSKTPEEDAFFHWREAQRLIADRDLSEARNHLQSCLQQWPLNAEAHFLMARCSRRENDYALWRIHLKNAELLGWPRSEIELERRLWLAQTGEVWSVEDALMSYLQTLPPEAELILEALAEGYLANFDVNRVLQLTSSWMERFPDDWRPHLYRGHAYLSANLRAQAIPEYRQALQMVPEQFRARLLLAGALMDDGQFAEALDHYQIYIRDDGPDDESMFGLAFCQLSLGKTGEAKQTLDRLLAINPNDVRALHARAKVAQTLESLVEALKWLRRAEALAPFETDISHSLTVVLRQLGKTEEADKYQKLREDILHLHRQLRQKRNHVRDDPQNIQLRYEVGDLNRRLGRLDEAATWFETALRIDPHHEPSQKALEEIRKNPAQQTPFPRGLPKQQLPETRE